MTQPSPDSPCRVITERVILKTSQPSALLALLNRRERTLRAWAFADRVELITVTVTP